MEKYQLGITLSRWAMIHYSHSMWKQPEFRDHLIQNSSRNDGGFLTMSIKLREYLDEILILPLPIKNELKMAIGTLGHRIEQWFRELHVYTRDIITFADCINHIHWSCNGTIDCTQSLKSLYKAGILPMTFNTWTLLCRYCVEECLLDFWSKISTNNEYNDVFQRISADRQLDILIRYWKFRMIDNLSDLKRSIRRFDDSKTVEENVLTASNYQYDSFRYFWDRLDEPKRQSICRITDTPGGNFYGFTLNVHNVDLFMFIHQQLMIRGSEEMLNKMTISTLMVSEIHLWPFANIFMSVLHDFYCRDNSQRIEIMRKLLLLMFLQRMYIDDDSETRQVFYDFWKVHQTVESERVIYFWIVTFEDMESLRYAIMQAKIMKETERIMNIVTELIEQRCVWWPMNQERFEKFFDEIMQDLTRD